MVEQDKVYVVGAGIAGLSAAIEIGKTGQEVVLLEAGKVGAGKERSEISHPKALLTAGAQDSVRNTLHADYYVVPERPGFELGHYLQPAENPMDNPIVVFEHTAFLETLSRQAQNYPNIQIEEYARVTDVSEDDRSASLTVNGNRMSGRYLINSTGAYGGRIQFEDPLRRAQFDSAIVGVAYGKRFHGTINKEYGDQAILSSLSLDGSGRSSWVIPSGDGVLDVVWSDYSPRKIANNVINQNGEAGFEKLLKHLQELDLIEINGEAGPRIKGIFGLEPRRSSSKTTRIFDHGERAQTSSATVGDSIGPTIDLSKTLAQITLANEQASKYEDAGGKFFDNLWETAVLRTRLGSNVMGRGVEAILETYKIWPDDVQRQYLRDHKFPKPTWMTIPKAIINYPPILRIIADQIHRSLEERFRGENEPLDPHFEKANIIVDLSK